MGYLLFSTLFVLSLVFVGVIHTVSLELSTGLCTVFLGSVFLYDEVVDDEVLSLHGVLAHVVFQ